MVKAIILAAGRSKRMKPIEHKNLLKFCGKTLIVHLIEQLQEAGIQDFVVIGGVHNLEKLQQEIQEWNGGAKVEFCEQENLEEGMAGAVKSAANFLIGQEILLVSSNDIVEVEAYSSVLQASQESAAKVLLLAKKVTSYFPGGYLVKDNQQNISAISEKPGEGNEPSDLVNIVVHYHRSGDDLVKFVQAAKSDKDDLYETALAAMIQEKFQVQAVEYAGFWQAIKFPWHILDAAQFLFEKEFRARQGKIIAGSAQIAPSATIKGDVIIEDGVKIFENAVVQGPCYLGRGTIVANNALVRQSFIGANSMVGFTTEVARSYLGENVWTHSNYIGDSIIGDNVSFGAGTVTGNLRLDEKNVVVEINGCGKIDSGRGKLGIICGNNVRCGIQVSFMPGIKIGNGSFIGASIAVAQDIEDEKFVYAKTELIIKDNLAQIDPQKRKEMKAKIK